MTPYWRRALKNIHFMCYNPKRVWVHIKNPEDGTYHREAMTVSCGHCLECLQRYSLEWAYRIMDEASLHSSNCMITLTYDDKHLKSDNLDYRDFQLFLKRLRKFISPTLIRYFACGEYGEEHNRPHFHCIVFGWSPSDIVYFFTSPEGNPVYKSQIVADIWKNGFITVEDLTFYSAKYAAKYLQKYKFVKTKTRNVPPFVHMSTHPGIGYDKIYSRDISSDRVYYRGHYVRTPRYYLKVMERDGIDVFGILGRRSCELFLKSPRDNDAVRNKFFEKFLKKT